MSGPKLSEAELERLKQEQLEKERRELLRKLQGAQKAYHAACDGARSLKSDAGKRLMQVDEMYRDTIERELERILCGITEEAVENIKSPASYERAAERMRGRVSAACKELEAVFAKAAGREAAERKLGGADTAYEALFSDLSGAGSVVDVVAADFGFVESGLTEREEAEKEQEKIRLREEKRALYEEYLALAAMTDTTPGREEDFSDISLLERETERLRLEFRRKDEMDYIADQIDSVMRKFGYTFVSSRVLTRQNREETDFSLYQADEETGIEVYTDQSGTVMMRMAVLGDDPVITEKDREFSYQRQIDFCAGHAELAEALAERGVCLKQKSYQSPDRKHTFKVNMAGEENRKEACHSEKKTDRRSRRRAGSKKMQKM